MTGVAAGWKSDLPGLRLGGRARRPRRQGRRFRTAAQLSALDGHRLRPWTEPPQLSSHPYVSVPFRADVRPVPRFGLPGFSPKSLRPLRWHAAAARQAEEPTAICSGQRRAFVVTPRPCGRETTPLAGQSQAGCGPMASGLRCDDLSQAGRATYMMLQDSRQLEHAEMNPSRRHRRAVSSPAPAWTAAGSSS